jgi:hypothetical protein
VALLARLAVIVPLGAWPALMGTCACTSLHQRGLPSTTVISARPVGRIMRPKSRPVEKLPTSHSQWRRTQQGPAERMYSKLKTLFGRNQDSALADLIRSTMMFHYSNNKRASKKFPALWRLQRHHH